MGSDVASVVTNICIGSTWVIVTALFIASQVSLRRKGRRVGLWSDDASRLRALRDAGASPAIAEEIVAGNKINAIKAYRIETGLGLKEAKDAVEQLETAIYRYEPWKTRRIP